MKKPVESRLASRRVAGELVQADNLSGQIVLWNYNRSFFVGFAGRMTQDRASKA